MKAGPPSYTVLTKADKNSGADRYLPLTRPKPVQVQPSFGDLPLLQQDQEARSSHAAVDLDESDTPSETIPLEERALEALRRIIQKPDTTWSCPEQRMAVTQVLNLKTDILAIMRTGSGKSMLMILPTLIEGNKITVGVLPLRSLMLDYERRLTEMGLDYEKYEGGVSLRGASNLILVSADKARTSGWKQALGELHERKTVVRMVFDEGHFAFTGNDFRSALDNVHELRIFPMQMVVLSGTVPPQSENHVCHAFGLINPFIVRMSTSRPEICYVLEPPRASWEEILERVKELVEKRMPYFKSRDRALVFVPYLTDGKELASVLGCAFYSSGGNKDGEQNQQDDYDDWISGEAKIMVCTSAFGAGNDYSHVRLVIHAGSPWEMIGYTQESARAGRDGFPAHAFILPRKRGAAPSISPDEIDHKGVLAMHKLLHNSHPTTCVRFAITSFSDPMGILCISERRAQMCNGCHEEARRQPQRRLQSNAPSQSGASTPSTSSDITKRTLEEAFGAAHENSKNRTLKRYQDDDAYVKRMKEALNHYRDGCTLCIASHQPAHPHETFKECPHLKQGWKHYLRFKGYLHYSGKKPSACFRCHVPQYKDRLHRPFMHNSDEACDWPDTVVPIGYRVFTDATLRKLAGKQFERDWSIEKDWPEWLRSPVAVPGHPTNPAALFLWYYETIE